MIKKNAELIKPLFMVLMLIGIGLVYVNGAGLLIGFILVICALAGIAVLARRENSRPLGLGERERWESIRAKGKRSFVLKSARRGLFVGLLFLIIQLIRSRWTGESFSASSGFILLALFFILYVGGSSYAAMREWALYEERYKESFPQEPQHNKSLQPTPR